MASSRAERGQRASSARGGRAAARRRAPRRPAGGKRRGRVARSPLPGARQVGRASAAPAHAIPSMLGARPATPRRIAGHAGATGRRPLHRPRQPRRSAFAAASPIAPRPRWSRAGRAGPVAGQRQVRQRRGAPGAAARRAVARRGAAFLHRAAGRRRLGPVAGQGEGARGLQDLGPGARGERPRLLLAHRIVAGADRHADAGGPHQHPLRERRRACR